MKMIKTMKTMTTIRMKIIKMMKTIKQNQIMSYSDRVMMKTKVDVDTDEIMTRQE
jgi:SUMO ligase MMS21 Smc5/6 complex component